VYYTDESAELVKQLKFSRYLLLADFMARMMALRLETISGDFNFNYMVPIPLHPRRLRRRGYNQSELIAFELAKLVDIPVATVILNRVRHTQKQSRLDDEDRYFNVKNAFEVMNPHLVRNARILLIDDVYTTGSTLNSAAFPLKEAGSVNVSAFTFAHA
jgi:ComF family protein